MGGSASLAFLENSPLADRVVGLFLDAPQVDFGAKVSAEAADMGVPSVLTALVKQVAAWRYGFDWAAMDYVADAGALTTPIAIAQGTADTGAPAVDAQRFAASAPAGLVQLELFEGAGHTTAWNMDRARYERLLTDFLAEVAPTTAAVQSTP
jgi:alpha-beta hydrolase superfamily lysophospholipase